MTKSVEWYKVEKIFCKKFNFRMLQNSKIKLEGVQIIVEFLQHPSVQTFISNNFSNTIANENQLDLVYLRHALYLSFLPWKVPKHSNVHVYPKICNISEMHVAIFKSTSVFYFKVLQRSWTFIPDLTRQIFTFSHSISSLGGKVTLLRN